MSNYDRPRATVLRLLTKRGKAVVLTRGRDDADYDPTDGTWSGDAPIELKGVGVFLDFEAFELNGKDVLATDKKMLYQGDELEVGDMYGTRRAHKVGKLDPNESGNTILATVQLR